MQLASFVRCVPVFSLAVLGAWLLRRHGWALVLLAGPVLYFSLIHLVFVSSIRYREAAMLPALGLAAAFLDQLRPAGPATETRARDRQGEG